MNDIICLIGAMGVICLIYLGPAILAFLVYLLVYNLTNSEEMPLDATNYRWMGLLWYLWHRDLPPFHHHCPTDNEPPWMD